MSNASNVGYSRHVESYSRIVKEKLKDFTETRKMKKTDFDRSIVRSLRDADSRFLRVNDKNEYFEIGDKKAVAKATNAFYKGEQKQRMEKAV